MSSLQTEVDPNLLHERSVDPEDLRNALLVLALVPPSLLVRFSIDIVAASAKTFSRLINLSPLKRPVLGLDETWRKQLNEAEKVADDTLDRIVEWVLTKVDINEIVREQVDVEAIIQRVDVVALAREVVYELDLPEIVRSSSQTMAAETVDGLRRHGMSADRTVSEFIDRLVGRKPGRGTIGLEQPT